MKQKTYYEKTRESGLNHTIEALVRVAFVDARVEELSVRTSLFGEFAAGTTVVLRAFRVDGNLSEIEALARIV